MTGATTGPGELTIRQYTETDQEPVLGLLSTALAGGPSGERTAEYFRWKHVHNPFGRSFGLVAEDEGRLVGVRLVMRWQFHAGAAAVSAGRMVDTATDPVARGRGVFRDLTLLALEHLREDTALIFNTPNSQSRPGYLKMGWTAVGTVPTSLSPVRPLRVVHGLRSATAAAGAGPANASRCLLPSLRSVLQERAAEASALLAPPDIPEPRLHTVRDLEFLHWRYADAPGLDYRAVVVEQKGSLVGLGIGRLRGRGRLSEFTLADVLTRPGDRSAARRVLRAARGHGADHVATHQPPSVATSGDLLRAGYLTTGRLGLTLTTRPLGHVPVDPTRLGSWGLALGDLEVF